MAQRYDVRDLLPRVRVPTVVMHSAENTAIPVDHARYLAAHIPGAVLIEFSGSDHAFMFENPEPVLVEIETLVTGNRPLPEPERVFAAIVFTDIVDSTRHAANIGDRAWRELIERHDTEMAALVTRHGGRLVKTIGDGVLAAFPLASHALRFAEAASQLGARLKFGVRVGVHAGEVDQHGDDLAGVAVNLSARLVAIADAGQVIVSSTVRDLVSGGTFEFRDLGTHSLKGFAEPRQVFELR